MNNSSSCEANPASLGVLNGQEGENAEEKRINSTGTGGDGGFEEAVTGKDWRFDPFAPSNELITGDDQGVVGSRSGEGGLRMENQGRSGVINGVVDVPLLPPLSSLSGLDGVRGKGEPQVVALDDEILIESVDVPQPGSDQKKKSKLSDPPKEESVLRNERAKRLLSEKKKAADGNGYMADKAQTWLVEHRRKGRDRALRSRKKQKAKAAAKGLLQLQGSDDEGENGGVKKEKGGKDGEKTESNTTTKGSEGGKGAHESDEKLPSPIVKGHSLIGEKFTSNDTREL